MCDGALSRALADAKAWQDNYDGMFWRWAKCESERLALKEELLRAGVQGAEYLRVDAAPESEAATAPPAGLIRLARALWSRATDLVLGARCPSCNLRVFPKDRRAHRYACPDDRATFS